MSQAIQKATRARPEAPVHHGPAPGGAVDTEVNYLIPPLGRHSVTVTPVGAGDTQRTGDYIGTPVRVRNARTMGRAAELDREGFTLGRQVASVRAFEDDDEIRAVYYPEMAELVRRAAGAREVVVFDHNVRTDGGARTGNSRLPVRIVHNDYTQWSGPQRVRDVMGEEPAGALLERRFAIVNVWRSIAGPVQASPLGLVDAGSVRPFDLIPTDLVYPDRVGEIYEVSGNAAHRWYYYPRMNEEEVLFIKGYDSCRDVARFTPHSAFDDPGSSVDAPPRRSIETRALVFF